MISYPAPSLFPSFSIPLSLPTHISRAVLITEALVLSSDTEQQVHASQLSINSTLLHCAADYRYASSSLETREKSSQNLYGMSFIPSSSLAHSLPPIKMQRVTPADHALLLPNLFCITSLFRSLPLSFFTIFIYAPALCLLSHSDGILGCVQGFDRPHITTNHQG